MSRLYNDCGSMTRDLIEGNLNCVNFPDVLAGFQQTSLDALKHELLLMAVHERECSEITLDNLTRLMSDRKKAKAQRIGAPEKALVLFTKVSQLYGDIYLAKDISNFVDAYSQNKRRVMR